MGKQPHVHPYDTGKLPPRSIIGEHYVIVQKIAQGGMGAIYEAFEASPQARRLAVKEMSFAPLHQVAPELRQNVIDSFRREFQILSTLNHPNLVKAYNYFEENERPYFVMEYLDGRTLEDILEHNAGKGFLPTDLVLSWARQLCNVLAFLHSQQPPIIYRDLKPSNIMEMTGAKTIKLIDFGIARFYKPGRLGDTVKFGTPGYTAPEAIGGQTNVSTDVFALGALLHQLLTYHDPTMNPFQFPPASTINAAIPRQVERAVHLALELQPEKRLQTMEAFLRELFGPSAEIEWPIAPETASPPLIPHPSPPFLPNPTPARQFLLPPPAPHPPVQPGPVPVAFQLIVSPQQISFGSLPPNVSLNKRFNIVSPPNISGIVSTDQPWLEVQPASFLEGVSHINVKAQTTRLSYGQWDASQAPAQYHGIPRWLRLWIDLHIQQLVPAPRKYLGTINVEPLNVTPIEINVELFIHPPAWRVKAGWMLTFFLLLLEFGFLLSPVFLVLLNGL